MQSCEESFKIQPTRMMCLFKCLRLVNDFTRTGKLIFKRY
uniref:Uncharacterized protein n=1 Tax=Anguilla anguilla TaxID=7936 RepID=A0A0E9T037_ANGAN